MSDRSYFQIVIHDAPADELAALREALDDDAGPLGALVGGANEEPDDGETFPLRWGWTECPLDAATSAGPVLAELMPGATFSAWVDPKYEYPGELYEYASGLGAYVGPCDADGYAYLRDVDLLAIIDGALGPAGLNGAGGYSVRARAALTDIGSAVGLPWARRIRELAAARDGEA